MNSLRDSIYERCLVRNYKPLANGDPANIKLDLERLKQFPELQDRVVDAAAPHAKLFHPDVIVPVPNGANWLGQRIAKRLRISVYFLEKDADKQISCPADTLDILRGAARILIVEDVLRKLSQTAKTITALDDAAENVAGVLGVFNRGRPEDQGHINKPVAAVISEHIPDFLPDDSPLWSFVQ